jgi:DNA-binding NarL/FixJ family response regulator
MIRIGLTRVLQGMGVRVVGETGQGPEGLAHVKSGSVTLFIVGQHPGSTVDLVRQAKNERVPPVVAVLVSQEGRDDLGALLSAGVDGLWLRSIGPDELVQAVGRLLDGERVISPVLLPALVGLVAGTDDRSGSDNPLTSKEREVLAGLAGGSSNQEIATLLFMSGATVKTHLAHIYAKLGVNSRHEALARAVALGLLE